MEGPQFPQLPPNLSQPPPIHLPPPNMSLPPPHMGGGGHMGPPPMGGGGYHPRFEQRGGYNPKPYFRPFQPSFPRGPLGPMTLEDFDGKRLRKSVMRKTVDYNSAIINELENRIWQRDFRDRRALQPDVMYYPDLMPPPSYPDNAINCVTTRFVKTATNKMRCPIFCMAWTPEGRRLVTGASSGEFTLWNGLTFNFETILQAHDSPVRTMVWSHNDSWMVTGDHAGYVKYWQSNMNNVKMFQAHKEALRGISFSPTDSKFVTCSDDGTLRIWDFLRYHEERILRGHGADVKCVHWHPQKGLIISGSKDNQQPIKLWDPKTGQSLATLHAHKSTVMDLKWNENGNWLITASRDHLLKLFDLRNLSQEVQTFRGHKKEASSVAWHPTHEGLFSSGGSDGSIMFWHVGADKEVGAIEQAHDSIVWTLAWHPLGHILCSGSNDHTSKFWTRNRPGDQMRDKYNLNTLPAGLSGVDDLDIDEPSVIPGMGPEDKVEFSIGVDPDEAIPGLDLDVNLNADDKSKNKKVPYSKPIPRNFQANWNETGEDETAAKDLNEVLSKIVSGVPGAVPLTELDPSAIIMYGKMVPIKAGSKLREIISEGPEAIQKFIASGAIEELQDVMPMCDEREYDDEFDEQKNNDQSNTGKASNSLGNSRTFQFDDSTNSDKASERPRKSRFSDLDDTDSNRMQDQDMRQNLPPTFMPRTFSNQDADLRNMADVDLRNMNRNNRDLDSRDSIEFETRNSDSDMRGDVDFRGGFVPAQTRDSDFRRFDSPWQSNGNFSNASDNFNSNRMPTFGPNGQNFQNSGNFRPGFSNFRPDGPPPPNAQFRQNMDGQVHPWNGRMDNFRGRGGFGPPRGGPMRPPRGFPGPPNRGGAWRGAPASGPVRGRNVF